MTRVNVRPALYRWAVDRARLDDESLDKRFPKLREWVAGDAAPTMRQLEDFAAATHAPLGYFFLAEPPHEELPIPDYRTVGDAALERPSADLLDTIYIAQQRQDWYREFASAVGQEELTFIGSVAVGDDVVATARTIREAISLDLDERARLPSWERALRRFVELVEQVGVLVMVNGIVLNNTHRKLDPDEFRGFTLVDRLAPLVFINGADTKSAQMFTLGHELAHLWAGQSAISNADSRMIGGRRTERWCNAVAAELLVPEVRMRQAYRADSGPVAEMKRLATHFKVSTLVVLRRIYDIGGMTSDEYWTAYDEERERLKNLDLRTGTGGDFHRNEAIRVGRRFGTAIVTSTLAGETTYRQALHLLGISTSETLRNFGRELGVTE